MEKEFSTQWVASKQPRKQRKYIAKAPIHLKKKLSSVGLSKELRAKYSKRSVVIRKGDEAKVMVGSFKGKQGKVVNVNTKRQIVVIEGIQRKKQDGSKVNVKLKPSNLQIIGLNVDDKRRIKTIEKKVETKENKK